MPEGIANVVVPEIEVTEAMFEAGVAALGRWSMSQDEWRVIVFDVYESMVKARRPNSQTPGQ